MLIGNCIFSYFPSENFGFIMYLNFGGKLWLNTPYCVQSDFSTRWIYFLMRAFLYMWQTFYGHFNLQGSVSCSSITLSIFFFGSLRSSRASRRGRRQTFFCYLIYSLSASVALEFLHVKSVFEENRTVVNDSCSFEFSTGKHLSKPRCRV